MPKGSNRKRDSFSSSIGFILSAAGSAIGLGNIWKFPYVAGNSGGGLFLIFYIAFVIILGVPIILAEIAIGRKTQLSPVLAYNKLKSNWGFIGIIGVVCGFILLSYYSVISGWIIKYIFEYINGANFGEDKSHFFNSFTQSKFEPIIGHAIFIFICAVVVIGGIEKGIEKASKVILPILFILIIIMTINSLTLSGNKQGLTFFFVPQKETLSSFKNIISSIIEAMGQVFFSLSLGIGVTITYGSYLGHDNNIQKSSISIALLDTLIALFSGMIVLPAVFSFNIEPSSGPGLIFEALPAVFESMSFGNIFGLIFFILIFFAALTSAIALLEVVCSYVIDKWHIERKKATIIVSVLILVSGTIVSLSMGILSHIRLLDMNVFNLFVFLTDKILMPVSALLMCIFIGHIIDTNIIIDEIKLGAKRFKMEKIFSYIIKYVAPIIILAIFIIGIIDTISVSI